MNSNHASALAARGDGARFARDFLPYFAAERAPVIDKVFSFDEIADARAYSESDAPLGEVVVRMLA